MIVRVWADAVRFVFASVLVLAAGQATAAGSLAIDTLQGEKYGFSFNHPSGDQADQRAMRECGADCGVVMRFRSECAAYSADQAKGSNAYGWGTGSSSAIVQQRAQSECRAKGGSSCKVRAWGCDATVASAQESAPRETPSNRSAPARSEAPVARETPSARSEASLQGEWLVDYVSGTGYTASGTLQIAEKIGNGSFRGVLVLAYVYDGPKRVSQNAVITVAGSTVTIECSNPAFLQGNGNYNPDNYTLTLASNNLMRGDNKDSRGMGGKIILSRK